MGSSFHIAKTTHKSNDDKESSHERQDSDRPKKDESGEANKNEGSQKDTEELRKHQSTSGRKTVQKALKPPSVPKVTLEDEVIKVNWKPVEGASNHTLAIFDEAGEPVREETDCTESPMAFPMTKLCGYGKKLTFVIKAFGGEKEKSSKKEVIWECGKYAVTDVIAEVSRENPKRGILVTWKQGKTPADEYQIFLYEENNSNMHHVKTILPHAQCSCTFSKLKSNTSYYCKVFPVRKNKLKPSSHSNTVRTEEANRNWKFDITKSGKPQIQKCEAILKDGGKLWSAFEWDMAILQDEAANFELVETQALVVNTGSWVELKLEFYGSKAKPMMLDFGSKYEFAVKCKFKDLDSPSELIEVETTTMLYTDIGSPIISTVFWENDKVILDWQKANGATKHVLTVYDNTSAIVRETELVNSHHIFTMDAACSYGKTYKFVIQATGGQEKVETAEKNVLIGGDTVCTDVLAEKDKICPKRAILVSWKTPKTPPIKYKVEIMEENKRKALRCVELHQDSHKFENLKSNTTYVCRVCPIYINATYGNCTISRKVKTDETHRNLNFDVRTSGKPKIQKCEAKQKFDGQLESVFEWKLANLGDEAPNFELVEIRALFIDQISMQEANLEIRGKTTNPISLSFGSKYEFTVNCKYRDLDQPSELLVATSSSIIYTDIGSPAISNVYCENDKIILDWQKANGATKHDLTVYDNTAAIVHETELKNSHYVLEIDSACFYGKTCKFVIQATDGDKKVKTVETDVIIGGDTVCTEVFARNDEECPKRAILVTWKMSKTPPVKYKVEISEENKGTASQCVELDQAISSHKFENLKSNTTYICRVFPIYASGSIGKGSASNKVETDKTDRNLNFDIKVTGKPTIEKCEAKLRNDGKLESVLEWNYANLDEKAFNFGLVDTRAFFADKSSDTNSLLEIDGTKAVPVLLNFGSTYEFTVKCVYKDFDHPSELLEAASTFKICTDIGTPQISGVNWNKDSIMFKWQPAAGATQHKLTVFDSDTKLMVVHTIELVTSPYLIQMSSSCCYGKTCNFVIQATGGEKKQNQASKTILIGGNTVCTNVVAQKDVGCPRRAIAVTWKSPKKPPTKYKVEISEVCKPAPIQFKELSPFSVSHKFEDLKTNTKYLCRIFPLYERDEIGQGSCSNEVTTDKRMNFATEQSEIFGQPESFSHQIISSDETAGSIIQLSWGSVHVGENFKIKKYHLKVYEAGIFNNKFINTNTNYLDEEFDPDVFKASIPNLKVGKEYQVHFVTTYYDLDTMDNKAGKKKYQFTTQPASPQFKGFPVCTDGYVTLKWNSISGVKNYHIKVQDSNTNITVCNKEVQEQHHIKLKISDKLRIGRTYRFTITSVKNSLESQPNCQNYLLGGDFAVTDVVVTKDAAVPRRAIVVEWTKPRNSPEGYQVEIYVVEKDRVKLFQKYDLDGCLQAYKFTELKTSSTYLCKVSPMYTGNVNVGSYSDQIQTDKRVTPDIERRGDFGKPEKFSDDAGSNNRDDSSIELSWSSVNSGENYKIDHFCITVNDHHAQTETAVLDEELSADTRSVIVKNVEKGHKYDVKFTTVLLDFDSYARKNVTQEHSFSLRTHSTNVEKCEIESGLIVFTLNTVEGAQLYHLTVKDEFLSQTNIFEKKIDDNGQTKVTCQAEKSEQLCIGRTCMTKVTVCGNNLKAESDWKPHLIGGDLVPRNVKARMDAANPQRCVQLTFDAPKKCVPDEYKVVPKPKSKIYKEGLLCRNAPVVMEYLRQGTEYSFHVSARHGDKWSEMSSSNILKTQTRQGQASMQDVHDVGSAHFDYRNAVIKGGPNVTLEKGNEFGQVRDIKAKIDTKDHKDVLELEWKIPTFGNKASDYKVEKYRVEICQKNSNMISSFEKFFCKSKQEYCTEGKELELGETYEISISTTYVDIDEDEEYTSSSAKVTVVTRPCQPKVIVNKVADEKLNLSWNHANGANHYIVRLFTDDLINDPVHTFKTHQNTTYEKPFDEKFGFGKTYFAVIEAIGIDGKTNSIETKKIIIGEDHVPREVKANITQEKVTDPSTQIYLEWNPPEIAPIRYEVMLSNGQKCEATFQGNTKCIVSGLNAGSYYIFKVIAIHKDVNDVEKKSGGCLSNRIGTSPKPNQVQNVRTKPGLNPCTSIVVEWDEVNVALDDEEVRYRVSVTNLHEKIVQETMVTNTHKEIRGLAANTSYFTAVAGGNSKGFGRNSAKLLFKTATGKPQQVELVNSEEAPSTALILQFAEMEGISQKYFGRLYKDQTIVAHSSQICNRHIYTGLDPNTRYSAEVYAVFEIGENGMPVRSNEMKTAPGKPEIADYGCCSYKGVFSSRDLFLKWINLAGLSYYEVRIIFERNGETERNIIINNGSEMMYSCQHEACQYSVQVRAKNEVFSDWSEKKLIDLGPPVLENLEAELDSKSNNIIIQCSKSPQGPLQYCMQALCNGVIEGKFEKINHESVNDDIVSFSYLPQKSTEKYSFQMWAEMPNNLTGEMAVSNTVISRPGKVRDILITPAEENPNMIKILWTGVARCSNYELLIQRTNSETRECLTKVKDALMYEYICCQPEDEYNVFVRGLYKSIHGDWSDGNTTSLEPPALQNIRAELTDIPSKNIITIQCNSRKTPLCYCMQALCKGANEGNVMRKSQEFVDGNIVKFNYMPQKSAEVYSFQLWAEYPDNNIGKKACSNTVISRPEKITKLRIKPAEDNPSAKVTLSWDKLERCDIYEVWIQCCDSVSPESVMKVENANCEYICNKSGEKYIARVRGLRGYIGGVWSDDFSTCLEPLRLQSIKAVLDMQGENINIQCKKSLKESLQYCMQALCNGVEEGNVVKRIPESPDADIIKFSYTPQKCAEVYLFQLWVQTPNNTDGEKAFSNTVISKPGRIRKVLIKPVEEYSNAKVNISWNKLERCDVYEVWIRCASSEDPEPECVMKVDKTSCEYICYKQGHIYIFRVRGLRENIPGKWSDVFSACLAPPKVAKVEVNVTANPNVVNVTWTPLDKPPIDYVVALYQDGEKIYEERTSETQCQFMNRIKPGSLCYCTVAANNASGRGKIRKSDQHRCVSAMIKNLRSRLDAGSVIYEWDPLEPKPDKYVLKWRVNNESVSDESTEGTSFKRQLVKGAQSYELSVAAANSAGIGKMVRLETLLLMPAVVENLRSRLKDGNIIYEWDSPEKVPDEYFIQWRISNGESVIEDTTSATRILKRLVKGVQMYELRVAASNSAGRGKFACVETHVSVPKLVGNLRSKEINGAIVFEWDALETPPDEYIVQWRIDSEQITEETTKETEFVIRFSRPAHAYNLRVMASNIIGIGKMSKWNTFITDPLPPRNLQVISDKNAPQTSFIVTYEDEVDPLKEYRVTAVAKEGGRDIEKKSVKTKRLRAHITGLGHGKSYFMKVQTFFCGKRSEELFYDNE